jgi:protein-arginine kinase activator protein McsA
MVKDNKKKETQKMKKCKYCKTEITEPNDLKPYNLVWCPKCDQTFDKKVNVVKVENGVTFYGWAK